MPGVNDSVYRITLDGRQFLTAAGGGNAVLLPERTDRQAWEVQQTEKETWVIRPANSSSFLGFDGEPDTFERVRVFGQPSEWRIIDGPQSGTYTIGVPDSGLTLGLHPALVFPPLIALSPVFGEDKGWSFESIN
ncbi:hypothetical protein ND748_18955 [Frankia sp. AiPs1]|uniref:hypothetical protein n=1 Tax=Frankia sp. AiPs1 TaxID=573493 RepID=UPI0020440024|nr:hypothetical protein [Frankia sp. AiPs1]MCM3923737.1 hypothetical protein [Frankia sp. AiPs1]